MVIGRQEPTIVTALEGVDSQEPTLVTSQEGVRSQTLVGTNQEEMIVSGLYKDILPNLDEGDRVLLSQTSITRKTRTFVGFVEHK